MREVGYVAGNVKDGHIELASALDKTSLVSSKLTDKQKEYAAAVAAYSTPGGDYIRVLNEIGNSLYEGIVYDHNRGKSVETLSQIYKVSKQTIEDVIKSEEKWKEVRKDTSAVRALESNMESLHETRSTSPNSRWSTRSWR
jgi:Mor family transcriptional regulator